MKSEVATGHQFCSSECPGSRQSDRLLRKSFYLDKVTALRSERERSSARKVCCANDFHLRKSVLFNKTVAVYSYHHWPLKSKR
jgi:hypothetical protein